MPPKAAATETIIPENCRMHNNMIHSEDGEEEEEPPAPPSKQIRVMKARGRPKVPGMSYDDEKSGQQSRNGRIVQQQRMKRKNVTRREDLKKRQLYRRIQLCLFFAVAFLGCWLAVYVSTSISQLIYGGVEMPLPPPPEV